ncbi:hypothetical protein HY489_00385 [Candidatus Woesearchaeota archaeon]|nr:hypothetical protein [Candidatus Woesearchaeota archaeon]
MPEERGQYFMMRREGHFFTNILLLLILIGIIIIILILLWYYPWWWGWGKGVAVTAGGQALPGSGVVNINTCCPTSTGCPPERTPGCEENCKKTTGGDRIAYEKCVQRCRPGCEEQCKQKYANDPTRVRECTTQCNPPETCQDYCKTVFGTDRASYERCVQERCQKPEPTCEDTCKQRYANYPDQIQNCIQRDCQKQPETCEDYCKTVYGQDSTYYQQCVRERCQPTTTTTPDCRDTDGKKLAEKGEVHYDGKVYTDTCYDGTHVTEHICRNGVPTEIRETCPSRCLNGACVGGQPTYTTTAYK